MKKFLRVDIHNPAIYQEKVWGDTGELSNLVGREVSSFGDKVIGEVFLASTHPDGVSTFTDGRSFTQVIEEDASVFGGAITPARDFPFLLKALSATTYLSVQAHYKNKVEAWMTLSDGAMLYGLTPEGQQKVLSSQGRDALSEILKTSSNIDDLKEYFNYVTFSAGQTYMIHAGVVHALLRGTVIEPQKNANLTLRGGDWGRNDPNRKLHLDDFYEALYPYALSPTAITAAYKCNEDGVSHAVLCATEDFAVDEIIVNDAVCNIETFENRFFIGNVLEGRLSVGDGATSEMCETGDTFVLSASSQTWTVSGSGRVILTYVPDFRRDIIDPLSHAGSSMVEISKLGGPIRRENDLYIFMKEKGLL